jgi:hypothetical protein
MVQLKKNWFHRQFSFFSLFCFWIPFLRFLNFYFAFSLAELYSSFVNREDALAILFAKI